MAAPDITTEVTAACVRGGLVGTRRSRGIQEVFVKRGHSRSHGAEPGSEVGSF